MKKRDKEEEGQRRGGRMKKREKEEEGERRGGRKKRERGEKKGGGERERERERNTVLYMHKRPFVNELESVLLGGFTS